MKLERYRQIAMKLVAEIESGAYPEGSLFPTRSELAERFNVTRSTINHAVEILVDKALLNAKRGAGSVVINTRSCYRIAYVAPAWLMHYIPAAPNCSLKYLSYEDALGSRTRIAKLSGFDGIIWSHPDEKDFPPVIDCCRELPGTVLNRAITECNFITTDHQKCFAELVKKRLSEVPAATPCLLYSSDSTQFVKARRSAGFVAACRTAKRFYELLEMPADFHGRLEVLEHSALTDAAPLLVFADHWYHTGAVVQWCRRHNLKWKKDIYYADCDNTENINVWGMVTTSILQDFAKLSQQALAQLQLIIKEPAVRRQQYLDPDVRYGDT